MQKFSIIHRFRGIGIRNSLYSIRIMTTMEYHHGDSKTNMCACVYLENCLNMNSSSKSLPHNLNSRVKLLRTTHFSHGVVFHSHTSIRGGFVPHYRFYLQKLPEERGEQIKGEAFRRGEGETMGGRGSAGRNRNQQ